MLSDLSRRWCWEWAWLCGGGSASGCGSLGCRFVEAGGLDVAAAEEEEAEEWKEEEVVAAEKEAEEEGWAETSLLMGEMGPAPTDMAGAMSFRPKLSRLLDTLLMLSGAGRGAALEEELKGGEGGGFQCWLFTAALHLQHESGLSVVGSSTLCVHQGAAQFR